MLDASVVVCTHNRSKMLPAVAASLSQQTLNTDRFEVILVDNASSDETETVVMALTERHANLRYVKEPAGGLSHARNRGIGEAAGNVVAFMDDDAVADPDWLRSIVRAMKEAAVIAIGGRMYPAWDGARPTWLPESRESYYGLLDLGPEPLPMLYPKTYPYGGNMAMRASVFQQIGGFDPRLGRQGHNLISNEETDFFRRLSQLPGTIRYLPDAVVFNIVDPARVSRRWLYKRAFAQGQSNALALALRTGKGQSLAGGMVRFSRRAVVGDKRALLRNVRRGSASASVEEIARLSELAGRWLIRPDVCEGI